MFSRVRLAILTVAMLVLGCGPDAPEQCLCTEDFRSVQFLVISSTRAPVPVTDVVVELLRTTETLAVTQSGNHAGVVNVVDDSNKSKLLSAGDAVRVRATAGTRTVDVTLVVGVDQPCRCHVTRVSGPDFVLAQ